MSDLISRQDAIDVFDRFWDRHFNAYRYSTDQILKSLPAVDAVSVVRCGECKHLMTDGRCFEFADDNIRPSVSDYCSHGERREE